MEVCERDKERQNKNKISKKQQIYIYIYTYTYRSFHPSNMYVLVNIRGTRGAEN